MPCLLVTDVRGDAASKPVPAANWTSALDIYPYFCKHRNMLNTLTKKSAQQVVKYADMFSAMGTEPRLRIMQLLLSAHPEGLVVGEIQEELDIPNSTSVASSRQAESRRSGSGAAGRHFSPLQRQCRRASRITPVSVRRVLHPQPGSEVGTNHSNLQIGEMQ